MTIAFDQRALLVGTTDFGSDANISNRQVLLSPSLSAATGTQGQIVFYWGYDCPSGVGIALSYFGQGAQPGGTTGPTFTGNQVQVKWGGAATAAVAVGATASLCTIALTVLTVGGSLTGTWGVGQAVSGASVPANTVITSLGTGSGGAGTYNLNTSTTISVAEAMKATGVSTSDVFTLGETFDHTHTYVFAFDTDPSNATTITTGAIAGGSANSDAWTITTAAGTIASASSPTGVWSEAGGGGNVAGIAELIITAAGGDVLAGPMGLVMMRRKQIGWSPLLDHRQRILRSRRPRFEGQKLWMPPKKLAA